MNLRIATKPGRRSRYAASGKSNRVTMLPKYSQKTRAEFLRSVCLAGTVIFAIVTCVAYGMHSPPATIVFSVITVILLFVGMKK